MEKVTKVEINGLFNLPVNGDVSVELVKSPDGSLKLKLNINELEQLNNISLKECMFYWNKLTEIKEISYQLFNSYDFYINSIVSLKMMSKETMELLNSSDFIFTPFLLSFIYIYKNNKKNIKNNIKNQWCYLKIIKEARKSMPISNALDLVDSIRKYFIFKQEFGCKSVKEFYNIAKLDYDNILVFQKYRNIYRAFRRRFGDDLK